MSQEPNSNPDEIDALSAMAGGADLNEPDAYVQQQIEARRTLEGLPPEEEQEEEDAPQAATPAADAFTSAAASPVSAHAAARAAADRARSQASQAAAKTMQFRAFMVPLLMAVGILLIGIGILPWFYNPVQQNADIAIASGRALDASTEFGLVFMKVIMFCAVPIGLILIVGSAYFHMDVQRMKRLRAAGR